MVRRVVVAIVIAASALAAQGPQFEVASVKPADTPMGARVNGWDLRAGRLRLINQTLEQIIRTAYAPNMKLFPGLPLERMSGGPDWIRTESFAIVAKAPDGSLLEDGERQMTLMLRELLARRLRCACGSRFVSSRCTRWSSTGLIDGSVVSSGRRRRRMGRATREEEQGSW
jgi:hypothetical protein